MDIELRTYIPETWDLSKGDRVRVAVDSKEFKEISKNLSNAGIKMNLIKLERFQNLYGFGQYLVREQLLLALSDGKHVPYKRVRRYIVTDLNMLHSSLKHSFDSRRTGVPLKFVSEIKSLNNEEVVIVVQTVTDEPFDSVLTPRRRADFYIEYIAFFDNVLI